MTENDQDAILLEKALYRYTSAIERGDFETASAVLAQAEDDPRLEQMILEINGALADELPPAPKVSVRVPQTPWQRLRAALRTLAPGVGLSALVLLLVLGVSAIMGPAIGNTFSNTSIDLLSDRGANYDQQGSRIMRQQAAAAPTSNHAAASQSLAYSRSYPSPLEMPAQPAAQPTVTPYLVSTVEVEGTSPIAATTQPRLVVRNASLALTVPDTRRARDSVAELISAYAGEGAFILSSSESPIAGSDQPLIRMELRVPVARYDSIMSRLVSMALTVDVRQEQAQDVTAEYVDAQSRIKELETAIERLLEIAREAKTTDDLLRVERELSDRRAELETYKGRAQYLSQTAALSLIQLQLQPKVVYPSPTPTPTATPAAWRPQETVYNSWLVLLNELRRFGDAVIVFGITTLPWIAVMGLVMYGGYRVFRRGRRP